MLEHPSTNGGTVHTNERVHTDQKALIHWAETHPCSSDARHVINRHAPAHRYGLHRGELEKIRSLVHDATQEALTHETASPEWVADRVTMATERALFAVGVELLP